ncbi:MAG TPA: fasciclin domain-containing protein [Pseudonocardia sp.]|nr:fasciclin domain-containing protein [Pseudonocardia sp.]
MRKIQRLAAIGATAALTVVLGACGSPEEPATGTGTDTGSETTSAAAPTSPAAGDGVTEIGDIFGPACDQVPTEGEGSAQGMVDDPVGTAASNNPLLTTLVTAVTEADLVDTLNSAEALTVLAPFNGAFAEIPEADLNALLADQEALTNVLTYHVSGTRMDAAGLVEAGTFTALNEGTVEVGGTADAPTFMGAGNTEPATTLCGNIPTANATVFVIDTVLMPAAG